MNGQTMGTTYSIKIVRQHAKTKELKIQFRIDSVLIDINKKMSTYLDDSELTKFNNSKDTNWIKVSQDLVIVISQALEVSEASGGFYDITVGPLVNLWGFGPVFKNKKIPSPDEIEERKKSIGYHNILVDVENSKIKKKKKNIYCDLSSIAKGYGVDKVAMLLEKVGIKNYMVEIGGEVKTKGKNAKNEKWRIGIATPTNVGLQNIVNLSNYSMATSGDYLNYFEENGVRYSHTINPKTGKPITHKLASVSVIHDECSYADAFATAIDVMGPEKGYKFALQRNLPIFMIVRENNSFVEKMTPQFKNFITKGK
jgi:thiamine biosynthesis lipoprotein